MAEETKRLINIRYIGFLLILINRIRKANNSSPSNKEKRLVLLEKQKKRLINIIKRKKE